MILTLYITRRFALLVGQMVLIFFGILILIDMVDQLRRFSGTSVGLGGAARLAALNVPESLYRILPLIFIFAAITLFLGLARSSELVVIRAAGRSGVGFVLVPVGAALILGGLAVAVLNPIVAGVSRGARRSPGACGEPAPPATPLRLRGLAPGPGGATLVARSRHDPPIRRSTPLRRPVAAARAAAPAGVPVAGQPARGGR